MNGKTKIAFGCIGFLVLGVVIVVFLVFRGLYGVVNCFDEVSSESKQAKIEMETDGLEGLATFTKIDFHGDRFVNWTEYFYSFRIDSVKYSGRVSSIVSSFEDYDLSVGDTLIIKYSAGNPSNNFAIRPLKSRRIW